MAKPSYMSIVDNKGSAIKGGVQIADRKNTIEILAYENGVTLPVNPHTNAPGGVREHTGFKVVAVTDSSYPEIFNSLVSGTRLQSVTISSYAHDETGKEKNTHTIVMKDAVPVAFKLVQPNVLENANHPQQFEVTFNYSEITHTWNDGNVTATDNWKAARA